MEDQFGTCFNRPMAEAAHPRIRGSVPISPSKNVDALETELHNILQEVRIITNKIRDEVRLIKRINLRSMACSNIFKCGQIAFIVFIICQFTTMKKCPIETNKPKLVTIFDKY